MIELKRARTLQDSPGVILNQARQNKEVVYGAQAMNKQVSPFLRRPSQDYDLYSKKPLSSAQQLERSLDRRSGGNNYFVKPAVHAGTFKVQEKGNDNLPRTKDDVQVADYTQQPQGVVSRLLGGIRYVTLGSIEQRKKQILQDPKEEYRHAKDRRDVGIIQQARESQERKKFFPSLRWR